MPKGDKYIRLRYYLQNSKQEVVRLTFKEVEGIINDTLPKSAYKHPEPWWSNNKDHSQAIAWLDAGYETEYVSDTHKDEVILFTKRA